MSLLDGKCSICPLLAGVIGNIHFRWHQWHQGPLFAFVLLLSDALSWNDLHSMEPQSHWRIAWQHALCTYSHPKDKSIYGLLPGKVISDDFQMTPPMGELGSSQGEPEHQNPWNTPWFKVWVPWEDSDVTLGYGLADSSPLVKSCHPRSIISVLSMAAFPWNQGIAY